MNYVELLETLYNGNISDYKQRIAEMTDIQMDDFLHYMKQEKIWGFESDFVVRALIFALESLQSQKGGI